MLTRPKLGPFAFGGGPLNGSRRVRVVYMDEAGISKKEPWVVVAGVVVHGDTQWKPLERELDRIVQEEIPEPMQDGFILHATDLFHGSGATPRGEEWPQARRWGILDRIVALPKQFKLPLVFGCIERAKFPKRPETLAETAEFSPDDAAFAAFHVAFGVCTLGAERWMRDNTEDEIAQLIAENNDRVKRAAKGSHAFFRNRGQLEQSGILELDNADVLPFERVIGTVHFALKREDRLLQVADACAFFMQRKLRNALGSDRFFTPLQDQIAIPTIVWREPATPWPFGPLNVGGFPP